MFRKIIATLHIDKAILLTSSSTIIRAFSGFILSILIAYSFTEEEQGLYFTFISITAIQLLFELGLGAVITQFVSHEMPYCRLSTCNILEGNKKNLSRIASILRFCIRWYSISSILLFILLLSLGLLFFQNNIEPTSTVIWKPQWICLSMAVSINLFFSFCIPFFQGIGLVEQMASTMLFSQTSSFIFVMISIIIGLKLEIPTITLLSSLFTLIIILKTKGYFFIFKQLLKIQLTQTINYKKEIFPLQAKTSISWASGYLLNYSFTPIIFATMGSISAGKFGLTLSIIKSISAFTLSWVSTKIPLWSGYIETRKINKLNSSFLFTIKSSTIVSMFITISFILFIYVLETFSFILTDRLLPLRLILIWSICIPITNLLDGMATKIRCYKKEPYSIQAFVLGVIISFSTYVIAKFFNNLSYIVTSYTLIVCFINLPWSVRIYLNKSKEYNLALFQKKEH